jgi:hypothetical protein
MPRRRLLAALGAIGVVAICVTGVGIGVAGAAPHAEAIPIEEAEIPDDLTWEWVVHCGREVGFDFYGSNVGAEYGTDGAGTLEVLIGSYDTDGRTTYDYELSAAINACVGTRRVAEVSTLWREATPADRMAIYGWAVDRQQPCLAARGIDTRLPPLTDFLDEQTEPWYLLLQYIWDDPENPVVDFDTLLAARLACPPTPPYLAAQGVG